MNLNQVTIPVTDIAASIRFYEQLGLRLIVHSQQQYARFECTDGEATFSLHKVDAIAQNSNLVWIYFEVLQLDHFVGELVAKALKSKKCLTISPGYGAKPV